MVIWVLLLSHSAAAAGPRARVRTDLQCNSDMQIVMCGQIPLLSMSERRACCRAFRSPGPAAANAAAALQAAAAASKATHAPLTRAQRPDLDAAGGPYGILSVPLDWQYSSSCTESIEVGKHACGVQCHYAAGSTT